MDEQLRKIQGTVRELLQAGTTKDAQTARIIGELAVLVGHLDKRTEQLDRRMAEIEKGLGLR